MFVDADTHVDECPETWSYLPLSFRHLTPATITFDAEDTPKYLRTGYQRAWFIDGQVFERQVRSDDRTGTTIDTRQLYDVPARLKDMDELGVDIQIVYPTLFLNHVTRRPELEVALYKSYNRWLADRCSESGGRLRWVAMIPFSSPMDALEELRFVREHGACGAFKRGYEDGRQIKDPYFFPIYALAQDLELPICVHTAQPYRNTTDHTSALQLGISSTFYLEEAFRLVVGSGMVKKFPTLRFGFIEAGAGWLPHLLWMTRAHAGKDFDTQRALETALARNREILAESNVFVAAEVSEDLPYLIDQVGDDNLVVGSDYGHPDRAAVWGAQRLVVERADVSDGSAEKLTRTNAQALYGL